jgi:hypothetical protein
MLVQGMQMMSAAVGMGSVDGSVDGGGASVLMTIIGPGLGWGSGVTGVGLGSAEVGSGGGPKLGPECMMIGAGVELV